MTCARRVHRTYIILKYKLRIFLYERSRHMIHVFLFIIKRKRKKRIEKNFFFDHRRRIKYYTNRKSTKSRVKMVPDAYFAFRLVRMYICVHTGCLILNDKDKHLRSYWFYKQMYQIQLCYAWKWKFNRAIFLRYQSHNFFFKYKSLSQSLIKIIGNIIDNTTNNHNLFLIFHRVMASNKLCNRNNPISNNPH